MHMTYNSPEAHIIMWIRRVVCSALGHLNDSYTTYVLHVDPQSPNLATADEKFTAAENPHLKFCTAGEPEKHQGKNVLLVYFNMSS